MIETHSVDELVAEARRKYRSREYLASYELLCQALEAEPGHAGALDGLRIAEGAMRRSGQPLPERAAGVPGAEAPAAARAGQHPAGPNDDLVAELRAWKATRLYRDTSAGTPTPSEATPADEAPAGVRYIATVNQIGAGFGIAMIVLSLFTSGMLSPSGPMAWLLMAGVFVMTLFYGNLALGLVQAFGSVDPSNPVAVDSLPFLGTLIGAALFVAQYQLFRRLRAGSRWAYLGVLVPTGLALLLSLPLHAQFLKAAAQMVQLGLPAWLPGILVLWIGQIGFTVLYLSLSRRAREFFETAAAD
jgi:hypothetical protein